MATVTLSKSLGSQGGAVLGPQRVIRHLVETARTFIFDTGLAPAAVGAALGALRLLRGEPWRADRAREVACTLSAQLTAAGLRASTPDAAVVSGPRTGPGAGGGLGRRLPPGRPRGGLLPPAVGAGRPLLVAPDGAWGPDGGADRVRGGGHRPDGSAG